MRGKISFFFIVMLCSGWVLAQDYQARIQEWQDHLNEEFKDAGKSPLTEEDWETFEGLDFFDIDQKYCVAPTYVKVKGEKFEMPTSGKRRPIYQKVGELHFSIDAQSYQLSVYRNVDLAKQKEYKDHLFIPFKDHTNGVESYGGGRYLDIRAPQKKGAWELDFNKAYNPYCAYSDRWSCPIPPEENHLPVEIRAGVKKYHD